MTHDMASSRITIGNVLMVACLVKYSIRDIMKQSRASHLRMALVCIGMSFTVSEITLNSGTPSMYTGTPPGLFSAITTYFFGSPSLGFMPESEFCLSAARVFLISRP